MKPRLAYTRPRAIDIAPLRLRIALLLSEIMTLAFAGRLTESLTASRAMGRAYKSLMRAQVHNRNLELKLRMLMSPAWRARVLSDLGGVRRLAAWTFASRRGATSREKPAAERARRSAWWIEKTLRARARRREIAKACVHGRVFNDPCRLDRDGLFRLAPVARGPRRACSNPDWDAPYRYDPVPKRALTGAKAVAVLYPLEFYSAVRACAARRKAKQRLKRLRPLPRRRPQCTLKQTAGIRPRPSVRRYALP